MLYHIAPYLSDNVWGPFRLLGSYLVLMGLGATLMAFIVGLGLPRLWHKLPRDRGKVHAQQGDKSVGKPTGAGYLCVVLLLPVLLLVVPLTLKMITILACLVAAMLTGWFDDKAEVPWGNYLKGFLDLAIAFLTSLAFCQAREVVCWLPLVKEDIVVPLWVFLPVATLLLWMTINATNCSDGVDGLAGTLSLLSLFYLAGFLYVVVGHIEISRYLLIRHNPDGARWAVMLFTSAGALAGYLWHNAEPSKVLMGDAGSRFLGLLVGVAVLATGNPCFIIVVAPVVIVNGGTGIVKIALLRVFRRLGFDVRTPIMIEKGLATDTTITDKKWLTETTIAKQHPVVRLLHSVRFPLHDHLRKNLHWTNQQVLLRFFIIQTFLTPLLFGLLVKIR